jgi:hypothetical protein
MFAMFAKDEKHAGVVSVRPGAREKGRFRAGLAGPWCTGITGGVLVAVVAGCLSGPGEGGRGSSRGVAVSVNIEAAALAKGSAGAGHSGLAAMRPVDSAHVRVSGPGMDTLRFGFRLAGGGSTLSMIDIPAGENRRFEVSLHQGGRRLYAGAATVELRTDRPNAVGVNCQAEFSRVTASLHVPVDFPKAVAGGVLRLWNEDGQWTAPATVSGELRNFRLEEVPGDRTYAVALALWDAAGDTIATAHRAGVAIPRGQNVALVLPLSLAYTLTGLTMTVADAMTTTVVLSLPGGRRAPALFGEAVFSEVHPEPAADEGGENGEWLELFNRATDTLDVAGCQVIRDAGTSSGMKFTLPAGAAIAPGRGLVLARTAAVPFAQVVTGAALNLVNSASRLELSCAAVKVDTLRYTTSSSDTLAARFAPGKPASLKPSRLATRHKADAWCLSVPAQASTAGAGTGGEPAATPGTIFGGCGE